MIRYETGNLLDAATEALVNTVNTVGVMGKGVALMFKESYPENFRSYAEAVAAGEVQPGKMFVSERRALHGPKWIINFPTKQHWRGKSRIEWIESGLDDLVRVVRDKGIRSIAIPPLGCGHGGLDWRDVRPLIEKKLNVLDDVEVVVYEPTAAYQNVSKRAGVEKLTPARALIAELIRRYWILGIECTLLEVQKLAYFLEREIEMSGLPNPLRLQFKANRYGPYADRLRHLLQDLDGSYLRASVRVSDAKPTDVIAFNDAKKARVAQYLRSEAKDYSDTLERTAARIAGFESPLGMELLATVDWLLTRERVAPSLDAVRDALRSWPGKRAGARKLRLFDDRMLLLAIERLVPATSVAAQ
jgi:O-acetyl-ADP-ribose deacetylase (regulator of RNase III)